MERSVEEKHADEKIEHDHEDKDTVHDQIDTDVRFVLPVKSLQSFEHHIPVCLQVNIFCREAGVVFPCATRALRDLYKLYIGQLYLWIEFPASLFPFSFHGSRAPAALNAP